MATNTKDTEMAGPAPSRPLSVVALAAVQQQIENRRLENRLGQEMLARRGGSRNGENTRSDDRSHAQRDQAPDTQRLFQPPVGLFGSRDQSVDAFGAKELVHRSAAPLRSRFRTARRYRAVTVRERSSH